MVAKVVTMVIATSFILSPKDFCKADVIVNESFNYPSPGRLAGNTGGTGLDSEWQDAFDDKYYEGELAPKSLPAADAIFTSGSHAVIPSAAWNDCRFTRLLKPSAVIDTGKDGTYYISFLFQLDDLATNSATFQLENSSDNANHFLRIVEHFNISSTGTPAFRIEMNGGNSDSAAGPPLTAQTYFVLAKLVTSASGKGTVNLYVYPSGDKNIDPNNEAGSLLAASWTATYSFTKSEVYDQIHLGRWSSPGAVGWDEIRIATTFADAVTGGHH